MKFLTTDRRKYPESVRFTILTYLSVLAYDKSGISLYFDIFYIPNGLKR